MATQLQRTTQVNVSVVVNNAINSVRAIRATETSRKESEFQKAIAGGMSYADQLKYRQEQLDKEKAGTFQDSDYISSLEKSVGDTKKMVRFATIRTKYNDALNNYVTGKQSISSYVSLLNDTLASEQDETMRTELRGLVSSALKEQATNELNAIKNRALVAQKDNSVGLVNSSIEEIKSRRARAAISENDDEVAMWDETLIALNGAKSKLQIEDSLNEITFKINKDNPKANDKLGYLNNEIAKADSNGEITYNGTKYPSLKAFWENKRSDYIANGYFDEVKKDMDAETAKIASTSAYGQIPTVRIQAVNDFYNTLKARPEFSAYVDQIEQKRVENVATMANDLAEAVFSEEATTGDRAKAENAVLGIEKKFGVSVSREPFARELGAGSSIASEALKPTTSIVTPPDTTKPGGNGQVHQVASGENLSTIASKNGVTLLQLLDANPEYKANPSLVRVGATLKLPGAPVIPTTVTPVAPIAPVAPTVEQPKPTVTPTVPVTSAPTVAPVVTPQTQTTTPTNTQTSGYTFVGGDTLSEVALKNGTTVDALAKLNGITDVNKIKAGQTIKLK